MIRTLFMTHSSAPSGAELSLLRIVRAWGGPSKPAVLFGESGGLVDDFEGEADVFVLPMPDELGAIKRTTALRSGPRAVMALLGYTRRVRKAVRSADVEVVVGRSLKAVVFGRLATLGLPVTFVWSVHDHLTREYLGRAAWLYSRVLGHCCDAFVVNSMSTLATVRTRQKPVLVLPPSLRASARQRSTPANGLSSIVVVGRIAPWKGQDLAIEAFARELRDSLATLTIVGSPMFGEIDFLRQLEALTVSLGVADRVHFAGQVPEPAAYLVEADVLLHSSRLPEPFGAVVIEGMDAGCLVIATEPGGPAEVIVDGVNGILAAAGDLESMCRALRRTANLSEAERAAMVEAGARTVHQFDSTALTQVLQEWLVEVRAHQAPRLTKAVNCA
ncbi:glycosyltransferase family 4 protein [Nocardioides sp. cx-173]|uniref:glycosyltransferase family 4 protein n=1 Tax=Nocardioides sp. cx-173 TaxID=2898796 RepID=UPI001E62EA73|nr:glycosyltransferase family 4 protein [Nocardioides sp. cx-173]MCD4526945.1 glycosyltransferase family 4 protein [Nocardioides sp. cx-173]UGB41267.1 glycosyltransferase family 4 protein [Nocardioides sp. cx-173]